MKVLVIGYGSIGARHARILSSMGHSVAVLSRRALDLEMRCFSNLENAISDFLPDYVVVANETSEHFESIMKLQKFGFSGLLLIEKPLLNEMPVNFLQGSWSFSKVAVGYNLRFHPLLLQAREWILQTGKLLTFSAHCGQYLPDWRPNTDYRDSYSADKKRGGGVLRDLSHELDYCQWIAGSISEVVANGGHISNLEINSEDAIDFMAKSEKCSNISIHLNYLNRMPLRKVIATTESDTIELDFVSGFLKSKTYGAQQVVLDRDDTYKAMHKDFIAGKSTIACSWEEGVGVVKLLTSIECSLNSKKWESIS